MRIRLDLSYDGTDFAGWATQPGQRTVQGEIEAGLDRVLRLPTPARLTVAGRTDAGVHARAQVAHIDIPDDIYLATPGRSDRPPGQALVRRLRAVLPADIGVTDVSEAPVGFDARFSAIWRRYSYRVTDRPDPLQRRFELVYDPVDLGALNAAAALLVGERDFTPFCKARPGASAVRTLQRFEWREATTSDTDGDLGVAGRSVVVATVQADAFCHNMVRSLVGACLAVGRGQRDLDWLARVAASKERSAEVQVAPGHPLVLEAVGYPAPDQLADRARTTRAVRTLSAPAGETGLVSSD